MALETYRAAGQDWLAAWRRLYEAERQQGERATEEAFRVGPDFWEGQADRFAEAAARVPQPDGFMRFLLPRLRPGDTVLDIGAGVGRYEPVLSASVARVVAVEPSGAMRRHLQRHAGPRVEVVAAGWPEAEVGECDVAIAAHVLYGVGQIEPFLRRMAAVARRGCYLLMAVRHPATFISPFWERFHGEQRLPLPGALECLCALYQMGLPANLTLVPIDSTLRFEDEDSALADIRWRLRLAPEPGRDARLREAIRETLERAGDGSMHPRGLPSEAAVIWWEHP